MPSNISCDDNWQTKITFVNFFNKIIFFDIFNFRKESGVEKLLPFELNFLLSSLKLFVLNIFESIGIIVCTLSKEEYLSVNHFLWNFWKIVNNLKVSYPVFQVVCSFSRTHLIPKFFYFNFTTLFHSLHHFFNVRRHIVLIGVHDVRLSIELFELWKIFDQSTCNIAATRNGCSIFLAKIGNILWRLINSSKMLYLHLFSDQLIYFL